MKTSLTLDETVTRVRSEPWNDMGCERKCGKKQIHKEKEVCQFKQKLRLSSCSTVEDMTRTPMKIPPTHKCARVQRFVEGSTSQGALCRWLSGSMRYKI